jgi:hypothetical protein
MITFSVSEVSPGTPYERLDATTSIHALLDKRVEALGYSSGELVSCDTTHAFVKAAHDAFYDHHPLTIRPDDIWFCIAQGFATHVGQNTELLRSRLVKHEGKKTLSVERPDFFLGQDNPWQEVFRQFSEQIGEQTGDAGRLISTRFSTSTSIEIAAFDVCLMDGFQGYFDYEMRAGCGIPEITLLGSVEDWESMLPRVRQMAGYGLDTWCETLLPILEKISKTAAGEVDLKFWQSFFRYQSGSMGSELTGWMLALFPYLIVDWESKAVRPNKYLGDWKKAFDHASSRTDWLRYDDIKGPSIDSIPQSLASAPVKYEDLSTGQTHQLRFVAGMFGVEQDTQTLALAASFGWAIVYDQAAEQTL